MDSESFANTINNIIKFMSTNDDEKLNELVSRLKSKNTDEIIAALKEIKKEGDERYVPYLYDFFTENTSELIKGEVANLIRDLKDQNAVPYLMELIDKVDNEQDKYLLLSAFWQSRLDFGSYINQLVDIIVNSSYQTAFEGFTIIEHSVSNRSVSNVNSIIDNLKSKLSIVDNQKKPLISETIKLLETYTSG